MAPTFKRKCDNCSDVLSSYKALKIHRFSCKETESRSETSGHEQDSSYSDDEEEVYLDEAEIEDLLKTFKPQSTTSTAEDEKDLSSPFLRSLVLWSCLFICMWQSVFYISSNAIVVLLQFVHGLLRVASEHYQIISVILPMFPSSIYMLQKLMKVTKNNFRHYVTCPKCYSLYTYSDCVMVVEGQDVSRNCSFVSQPNHPQQQHRRPCGAQLLQTVTLPSGKKKLVPFRNYYYKPLRDSLTDLVKRPGFISKCQKWRTRQPSDTLRDVYDGQIWKDFERDFFKSPTNYGLMLNLDWFQPYKHVTYSVGVIYLVLLNLPREERFKRENVIIAGIIPHMKKEPPTNTFVQPLVDELLVSWETGFSVSVGFRDKLFKLALLCVGCDIPACRKLCGFMGHAARKGCSRCLKSFPGEFGKKDYSGFSRDSWIPRTHEQHIRDVKSVTKTKTKKDRVSLESKLGTRYSVLTELPYFDIVRMSTIDPMHNLFLGTAKHILNVWKDTGVLSEKDFETVQEKVDKVECPSDVGRIPMKIKSGFASFTADQFKNWTLLYSVYCLKGVIPDIHLDCWRSFVLACRYLCSRILTKSDIQMADMLLLQFCNKFEALYGHDKVTPNMHLHGHIAECLLDFGPVYSFWLFSFERFNGVLGDFSNNKKNIELQLMRRFTCHTHLLNVLITDEHEVAEVLKPILSDLTKGAKAGTIAVSNKQDFLKLRELSSRLCDVSNVDWTEIGMCSFDKFKMKILSEIEETFLRKMYERLYDTYVDVTPAYKEIKSIRMGDEQYGSSISRSVKSAYINAHWTDDFANIVWGTTPRPGSVRRYLSHTVIVDGIERHHLIAEIQWYATLPDRLRHHCGKPVEAWEPLLYVQEGPASFMPVQRIKGKFIRIRDSIDEREVMFACPRDRYS